VNRLLPILALAALLVAPWGTACATHLIAGNTDGNIRDVDTSVPGETFMYNIGFGATGLAVDDVNDILFASGGGGAWNQISIFDLASGAELVTAAERFTVAGYTEIYGLEYLSDGRLFSVGRSSGVEYIIEYTLAANGLPTGIAQANPIVDTSGAQPLYMGLAQGLAYHEGTGKFYSNQSNNFFWEFDFSGSGKQLFGLGLSGTNGLAYQDGVLYGLSAGHAASLVYFDLVSAPHQIQVADNTQVSNGWALTGTTTPQVPEPAALSLLAAAGAALAFLRRRGAARS
jgi:hypothetical protein